MPSRTNVSAHSIAAWPRRGDDLHVAGAEARRSAPRSDHQDGMSIRRFSVEGRPREEDGREELIDRRAVEPAVIARGGVAIKDATLVYSVGSGFRAPIKNRRDDGS